MKKTTTSFEEVFAQCQAASAADDAALAARREARAARRVRTRRRNVLSGILLLVVFASLTVLPLAYTRPEEPAEGPSAVLVPVADRWRMPEDSGSNSGRKTYTDFRSITDTFSMQYDLQQDAVTNPETGIREVDGYSLIAVGSYFNATIGQKFLMMTEDGFCHLVMIGDFKDDSVTDDTHLYSEGGVIVTFIVDKNVISRECRISGDMSSAGFPGRVVRLSPLDI